MGIQQALLVGGVTATDNNSILLLHADGTDNTDAWLDSSSYAHTLPGSTPDTLHLLAASAKFGSAGIDLANSSAVVNFGPMASEWMGLVTDPFCVEFFAKNLNPGSSGSPFIDFRDTDTLLGLLIYMPDSTHINFYWDDGVSPIAINMTVPGDTSFHHYAITSDRTTIRLFRDGILQNSSGGASALANIYTNTGHETRLCLFADYTWTGAVWDLNPNTNFAGGSLDELRIRKVVTYVSNFTPSTSAFTY